MEFQKAIQPLLQNEVFIFSSEHGKKVHRLTNKQKENNQITKAEDVKVRSNYNIWTGYHNIADVDLDSDETRELADDFLNSTGVEFGRSKHKGRSHRLYRILDLDKKKHTRNSYTFRDSETENTIIELRAHGHYTMCGGDYDDPKDTVIFNKAAKVTEITWDQLHKQVAMLGVASIMLRKVKNSSPHNEFYKYMAGALKQHKLTEDDAETIFNAVLAKHECTGCKSSERMGQLKHVYKREDGNLTKGLPAIVTQWKWSVNERDDFKKLLYVITGRHALPAQTNDFVKRIAYMMKQKKYYDLQDKEMYEKESIDVKYSKDFKDAKYTPLLFWKKHPDRKVCVDFTYKPAAESRFVTVDKKLMINIYEKNDLEPNSKVDTDIYDALLKHVIPHDDCRKHFLDWNAWIIQNKGKKIRHGIILQSDEFQLGKGSLYDVMRDILGRVNAKKIELDQALDKGKGFLINSIMVLIDEAKSTGTWQEKQQLINIMKTIMTEGSVGIRQLYKEYAEQDTCTNYWINTNHRDAFSLPPNEVRYWVYFSEAKRNDAMLTEYHDARFNHNLAAGVYAKMLDRNVSDFKPNGVAPHTIYRDMMTKLADKPVNDYVRDNFEQGVFPFNSDLVTTVELLDWLKKVPRVRVSREVDVANALKQIGGIRKKDCPAAGVGTNVNIWIIRNHDKYKGMTAKDLGSIYKGFWTDSDRI
tara:strand:- start:967 stop:3060 length:2094 start_codon:yes stop_codon:yes gene_type:complete